MFPIYNYSTIIENSSSILLVNDNHPFDFDLYISNYTGRTAIDHLIHIVSESRDYPLFQTLCHAYEQVPAYFYVRLPSISELPSIQSKWADETLKKNHSEKMNLYETLEKYNMGLQLKETAGETGAYYSDGY
ncbi:hypothetical protein BT96DRAFT_1009951 [Gymnopus androsaceus JB14]|uniref:Uncharacterized protein n=1 Tax=Gymnopus androsaceus JB14 TaxID=1447944 RepID=A0A6A4GBK3_9AGAR|nr:hypothetical protein BT96DRAFT_1009951 [Gymnopus androsaceus JB14]